MRGPGADDAAPNGQGPGLLPDGATASSSSSKPRSSLTRRLVPEGEAAAVGRPDEGGVELVEARTSDLVGGLCSEGSRKEQRGREIEMPNWEDGSAAASSGNGLPEDQQQPCGPRLQGGKPRASAAPSYWPSYGFANQWLAAAYFAICSVLVVVSFKVISEKRVCSEASVPAAESELEQCLRGELSKSTGISVIGAPGAADMELTNFDGGSDFNALLSSAAMSAGALPCIFAAFLLLRKQYPFLYGGGPQEDQRKDRYRRMSFQVQYTSYSARVLDPEADKAINASGLDGFMQLSFYTLNCKIQAVLGSVLLVILCPMHVFLGEDCVDMVSSFGISRIAHGSPLFWVHAGCVWFVVIACGSLLVQAQKKFTEYRYGWLTALPLPRATTLIVEGIPLEYRSDTELKCFFDKIFNETVEHAYVVRKTPQLRKKLDAWKSGCYLTSLAEAEWSKTGQDAALRPKVRDLHKLVQTLRRHATGMVDSLAKTSGPSGYDSMVGDSEEKLGFTFQTEDEVDIGHGNDNDDAINYYKKKEQEAEQAWRREVRSVEDAVRSRDPRIFSGTGFVTFKTRRALTLALDRRYRADPRELQVDMAPDPSDVVWKDLAMDGASRRGKDLCGTISVLTVFVAWTPLVIVISGLTSLGTLFRWLPALKELCQKHPKVQSFLEGICASLALKVVMMVMPNILLIIIRRFFLLKAGTWAQLKLQSWYFAFQVIFVVLAATLGRYLWLTFQCLMISPEGLFEAFETTLPRASHFFLSYVVLSWSLTTFYLLRPIALIKYLAFRRIFQQHEEAVRRAQDEHPAFFGTGVRMTKAVIMTTITLTFCMMSPLICLFSLIYFMITRKVYNYLLLNAEAKRPDLGGTYWVKALDQIFLSLVLFVVVMVGILWVRASSHHPAFFAAASLSALVKLWLRFKSFQWQSLPLEKVSLLDEASINQNRCAQYVQPEIAAMASTEPTSPRFQQSV